MSLFGRDPLAEAIRALQQELEGGPIAVLPPALDELGSLFLEREERARRPLRDVVEREILAGLPDAAALLGKDGRVRFANSAFDALSAGGRADGLTMLEVTRSGDLAHATKLALAGTARRLEVTVGRRSFVAQLTPLLRGEVMAVLRDDTDARRLEAIRRDFVANASHELRTPVTAIAGAAETLLVGALADPAQARGFVEIVARHAERLVRLTQDLLDLSRIETGQWAIEIADLELRPVAEHVLAYVTETAARKRMELRNQVPADLRASGDARALEQVLVNLVDNALKYTPEGGTVTLAAAPGEGGVILSVQDDGPGIERHHLARLFERFYRVDAGRSRELGGTGLGLAIVKHLVQAQHGEVGVESGSGGSRFWVRLPARP